MKKRILLIDNEINRHAEFWGFLQILDDLDIIKINNANDAYDFITTNNIEEYDFIVLCDDMRHGNIKFNCSLNEQTVGHVLYRLIRDKNKNIKIIMYSHHINEDKFKETCTNNILSDMLDNKTFWYMKPRQAGCALQFYEFHKIHKHIINN